MEMPIEIVQVCGKKLAESTSQQYVSPYLLNSQSKNILLTFFLYRAFVSFQCLCPLMKKIKLASLVPLNYDLLVVNINRHLMGSTDQANPSFFLLQNLMNIDETTLFLLFLYPPLCVGPQKPQTLTFYLIYLLKNKYFHD